MTMKALKNKKKFVWHFANLFRFHSTSTAFQLINNKLIFFLNTLQAALVIRGFVIRGFDYPRQRNCVQKILSADISLDYPRILPFFNGKRV